MKKIAYLFVMSILVLISSAVYADDGYYTCGSNVSEFNGKTFEKLVVDFQKCQNSREKTNAAFVDVTVIDYMEIKGNASATFINSSINTLSVFCSVSQDCEIGLDESTSIEVLELYPGDKGSIIVNGTAGKESLPAYYNVGYLCEGQQDFSLHADAENEIDFRMKDLDAFSDMGYIGETIIHAADNASVTFDNAWLHRVKILSDQDKDPVHFRLNTKGMTYIDLLDSGISFELHNLNDRHFSGDIPLCSPIASDYMRIGLMLLHSDHDLTVAMDNQYADNLVFFGGGCENSTLFLTDLNDSSEVSVIDRALIYDANAEFYVKKIPHAEFLVAPDNFSMNDFYGYFESVRDALINQCADFPDMIDQPGMCWDISALPESSSEYWSRMESAKVWSRLSGYVHILSQDTGDPSRPYAYIKSEPDIPYFYTRAAFIDTVKYSSAYSVSESSVPSYITGKGWTSLNPTLNADKTVGITWNGGCSYNHDMTVGGIVYRNCLENLPFTDKE